MTHFLFLVLHIQVLYGGSQLGLFAYFFLDGGFLRLQHVFGHLDQRP